MWFSQKKSTSFWSAIGILKTNRHTLSYYGGPFQASSTGDVGTVGWASVSPSRQDTKLAIRWHCDLEPDVRRTQTQWVSLYPSHLLSPTLTGRQLIFRPTDIRRHIHPHAHAWLVWNNRARYRFVGMGRRHGLTGGSDQTHRPKSIYY